MSWSSKTIAEGTVDSTQRMTGSLQASRYSSAYSTKSLISRPGGSSRLRRAAMNSSSSSCGVVSAYTWSPSSSSTSGHAVSGSSCSASARARSASTPCALLPSASCEPVVRQVPNAKCGSRVGSRRADPARRHPGLRPDLLVVDPHGVGVVAAGNEPLEHDEGVVRAVHGDGRGAPGAPRPLDGDPGRGRRARPHRRRGLVDVAEHGTQDERLVRRGGRHGGHPARGGGRSAAPRARRTPGSTPMPRRPLP